MQLGEFQRARAVLRTVCRIVIASRRSRVHNYSVARRRSTQSNSAENLSLRSALHAQCTLSNSSLNRLPPRIGYDFCSAWILGSASTFSRRRRGWDDCDWCLLIMNERGCSLARYFACRVCGLCQALKSLMSSTGSARWTRTAVSKCCVRRSSKVAQRVVI